MILGCLHNNLLCIMIYMYIYWYILRYPSWYIPIHVVSQTFLFFFHSWELFLQNAVFSMIVQIFLSLQNNPFVFAVSERSFSTSVQSIPLHTWNYFFNGLCLWNWYIVFRGKFCFLEKRLKIYLLYYEMVFAHNHVVYKKKV